MIRAALLVLLMVMALAPARAALTRAELSAVGWSPRPGADAGSLALTDEAGQRTEIRDVLAGRPALLVLSDFRCTSLCGPSLDELGRAMADPRLRDRALVLVGLDPADPVSDGRLQASEAGIRPAAILTGSEADVAALAKTIGFGFAVDHDFDAIAHPAGAVVLDADGHVSATLQGMALSPDLIASAMDGAESGAPGLSIPEPLRVLCYAYDPLTGRYTFAAITVMRGLAVVTVGCLGFAMFAAMRRRA